MAWKNQGGSPWGPGPKGPWGSGPQSQGPKPSDLEDLLRRGQDRLQHLLPGGHMSGMGIALIVIAGIAIWLLSGFFRVQPDELGAVLRFGKHVRTVQPGLNYHIPYPVETVLLPKALRVSTLNIGMTVSDDSGRRGRVVRDVPEESLMLTGDENIVNLDFSVTWRVADAAKYVFTVRDQEEAVKAVAESAMREVVGKTTLQDILTTGRGRVQIQSAELMQKTLDGWSAGVSIVEVQIRSANPPQEVVAAFREVANAGQDAESAVNEANSYRNRVINEAKGDAAKLTESAQGYREQAVREAIGEASRFSQILTEYKRAPGVTRDRLYIETMQRVLSRSNKVVIDGKGASAPIILPPDVFRPKTATTRVEPQAEGGRVVTPSPGAPQ